mgnify:CR=1 FL=1
MTFGELNVFISIVSVVALIVLVITGVQKFMDVLGIETKGSLRRKPKKTYCRIRKQNYASGI